jgi:Tfp pilus assembly protein PilX
MSPFATRITREPSSARQRSGFALPLAIMVLALVTIGLVAGFAMSTSEMSATASQRAQARAYSYAQMGLEQFLTYRKEFTCSGGVSPTKGYTAAQASACAFCPQCWLVNAAAVNGQVNANLDTLPTVAESVTVSFSSGKAFVRAVPVYLDIAKGKGTYFITSTGTDNLSAIATGSGTTGTASRTVGVYVKWDKTTMNVLGALTSFSGINKAGTGDISGIDGCGADTNVAGINIPLDMNMSVSGNSFTPTGNPPYDTLKTFSQDSAASKLDWAGIRNGTTLTADIDVTISSYPNFPTAATFAADSNYWPIIHVHNHVISNPINAGDWNSAFQLPWKGRGMLVVDGGMTITGSNQWDGVILVGGQLTSNGNNVTSGTVMAGLNRLIGESVASLQDDQLNGNKSYQYNSCSVKKATTSMARYTMIPNTWMDDISQY